MEKFEISAKKFSIPIYLEGLALRTPEQGSPQGAVIRLLLANLYLHPVDVAMAEAGLEMIR